MSDEGDPGLPVMGPRAGAVLAPAGPAGDVRVLPPDQSQRLLSRLPPVLVGYQRVVELLEGGLQVEALQVARLFQANVEALKPELVEVMEMSERHRQQQKRESPHPR